jgi:transposase InsO family protein
MPKTFTPGFRDRAVRMVLDRQAAEGGPRAAFDPRRGAVPALRPEDPAEVVPPGGTVRPHLGIRTQWCGPGGREPAAPPGVGRDPTGQRDPQEGPGSYRRGTRPPHNEMTRFTDEHKDRFFGRGHLPHPGCDGVWVHHLPRLPRGEDPSGLGAEPARCGPGRGTAADPRREPRRLRVPQDVAFQAPGRLGRRSRPGRPPDEGRRPAGRAARPQTGHHEALRRAGSPSRSGQAPVRRAGTEPAVGRPHHLFEDPGRVPLYRVHRCLHPQGRRLGRGGHRRMQTLPLQGLERALPGSNARLRDGRPVHHSDRGVQYVSLAYTETLAAQGVAASVGTSGNSYDNALADAVNGFDKAETLHTRRVWPSAPAVEMATMDGAVVEHPPATREPRLPRPGRSRGRPQSLTDARARLTTERNPGRLSSRLLNRSIRDDPTYG